jgi:hypothetical protein
MKVQKGYVSQSFLLGKTSEISAGQNKEEKDTTTPKSGIARANRINDVKITSTKPAKI